MYEGLGQCGEVIDELREHAPLCIASELVGEVLLYMYGHVRGNGQIVESVGCHAFGRCGIYIDVGECLASVEESAAGGLQAYGQGDGLQCAAVSECFAPHLFERPRQFAACESAESVELQVVVVEFAAYVERFHRIGVGRCQQKCILQLPFLAHCNVAFCHEL